MLCLHRFRIALSLLCCTLALNGPKIPVARADSLPVQADKFASGAGNLIFLGLGAGLPLLEDGRAGRNDTLRVVDAAGVSALFSEAAKRVTNEERPDHTDRESFPSGHATAAFAVATMESHFHPRQSPYWYGGASLIAASRVGLHRHFIHDVVAGAILGYATARWELSRPRGLILYPVISPGRGGQFGLTAALRF